MVVIYWHGIRVTSRQGNGATNEFAAL